MKIITYKIVVVETASNNYMIRTIKFRAWDNVEKQMTPIMNKFVCFTGIIFENLRDGFEGTDDFHSTKRLELMQFTGLLDKNGKEIYEGDILKDSQENIHEVIWNENTAGFDFVSKYACERFCEIIGNIYETPSLLSNPQE